MESFAIVNGVANFVCCERCGQAIKNVTTWQGKPYGPECIKVVTGCSLDHWVVLNGAIDPEATAKREALKAEKIRNFHEELARKEAEEALRIEKFTAENHWLRWDLLAVPGDFSHEMADYLTKWALSYEAFSTRALKAMANIYASRHGNKGSKKYRMANDEFWSKVQ